MRVNASSTMRASGPTVFEGLVDRRRGVAEDAMGEAFHGGDVHISLANHTCICLRLESSDSQQVAWD